MSELIENKKPTIPSRILADRKYILSHISMDMDSMDAESFYNHMKSNISKYETIPITNSRKKSKIKVISLQSISGWGVYVNEEINRIKGSNSEKLDFKSLIDIRKRASNKWKDMSEADITKYKDAAIKMNESYLIAWREKYESKEFEKFTICDELKNWDNIKTMKRKELLHYMGCIGKASSVTKNIKNSKMIEELTQYLTTKFDN